MPGTRGPPILKLVGQRFALVYRQRNERGSNADQKVIAQLELPESLQSEFLFGAPKTCQPQTADLRSQRHFAQFMVAHRCEQSRAELAPEFSEAFRSALEGCIVTNAV